MPNEFPPDDIRNVWQNQPVENAPMPLEEIQRRARRFEKRIDRRNLREYAGAALGIAAYTFYFFIFHSRSECTQAARRNPTPGAALRETHRSPQPARVRGSRPRDRRLYLLLLHLSQPGDPRRLRPGHRGSALRRSPAPSAGVVRQLARGPRSCRFHRIPPQGAGAPARPAPLGLALVHRADRPRARRLLGGDHAAPQTVLGVPRSEEHTSE